MNVEILFTVTSGVRQRAKIVKKGLTAWQLQDGLNSGKYVIDLMPVASVSDAETGEVVATIEDFNPDWEFSDFQVKRQLKIVKCPRCGLSCDEGDYGDLLIVVVPWHFGVGSRDGLAVPAEGPNDHVGAHKPCPGSQLLGQVFLADTGQSVTNLGGDHD